jgi:hypothetical protein
MEYIKIVIRCHTGYCGMDSCEFYEVNANSTDKERDDFAWLCAKENAEMYGIYPCHEYEEAAEEYGEEFIGGDEYSDNIEGYWETYNPDKHDGHRIGGDNSWQRIHL